MASWLQLLPEGDFLVVLLKEQSSSMPTTNDDERRTTVLYRPATYTPPRTWRSWLLGRPLATADAPHQTISKRAGLAVFASDALSSTAYATQEILVILAAAGIGAFALAFPISIAIVALLIIVTVSYEQTIHAYPSGGGAYIVSATTWATCQPRSPALRC